MYKLIFLSPKNINFNEIALKFKKTKSLLKYQINNLNTIIS